MSRNHSGARIVALAIVASGALWLGGWAVPLRAQTAPGAGPKVVSHTIRLADLRQRTPDEAQLRRAVKVPVLEYPEEALEKGVGGLVFIDLAISASGDVTTAAVVTGPEELRVAAFRAAMGLKFERRPETTAMRISVEYRIRSDSTGVSISWWDVSSRRSVFSSGRSNRGAAAVVWEQNGIRRDVPPPRKVKDVVPDYPAVAMAAGVQGAVVLEASIDEQGHVTGTRLLRSIPLLDQAAIEAVLQWQYEPTIVDGTAEPATVTVTVNFVARNAPDVR